jgi:hypothetical protein
MAELMYRGATCHARLECRDCVGIGHPQELMALPREVPDVISEGLA